MAAVHAYRKFRSAAATIGLAAGGMLLAAVVSPLLAQSEMRPVADEYQASCQVCHGAKGEGDGPLAAVLKVKPTDLTTLSKRNDGKFPLLKVMQTVDGRLSVPAHGTRSMPAWGRRYVEEAGEKYGPYGAEAAVRARLLELVYYIQSLQKE